MTQPTSGPGPGSETAGYRFVAPPNWPPTPPGWQPPQGWVPPAEWGPAPEGWQFWEPVTLSTPTGPATPAESPTPPAPVTSGTPGPLVAPQAPYLAGAPAAPGSGPMYAARPTPPTDGFAIAAFVSGLLGGVLFTIGFGIAALRRIKRGERSGKGFVYAGWAATALWILGIAGVVVFAAINSPTRASDGTVSKSGTIATASLQTGDCLTLPTSGTVVPRTVTVVPCSQPHNAQVYTIYTSTDTTYPGFSAMGDEAVAACEKLADQFVDGAKAGHMRVYAIYPDAASWAGGDHKDQCLAFDPNGTVTGSVLSTK